MACRRRCGAERIDEMLALVELTDWRERLVRTLSSGMKRRLEIARALVHDSRILFLDEPTVGLDAQSRERLWQYVHRLRNERELTVIVTTHYIEEVEGCDRVCIIDHGRILAHDTPAALKTAHGQELIRVVARDETDRGRDRRRLSRARDAQRRRDRPQIERRCVRGSVSGALSAAASAGSSSRSRASRACSCRSPAANCATRRPARASCTYEFGKRGGEHTK